jgi:superfamily I DNA/RNA helicase
MVPGRLALHLVKRIEEATSLDPVVGTLHSLGNNVLSSEPLKHFLRGRWLGHAFHPLLTDFVEGPWMAASFLDWFGPNGSSSEAQRLLGFGLIVALPTHLSGLVEWLDEERPEQLRVGLVHLTSISVATGLYATSYLMRRKDRESSGRLLGLAAGLVALADGYVGGHMSHVRLVATGELGPNK